MERGKSCQERKVLFNISIGQFCHALYCHQTNFLYVLPVFPESMPVRSLMANGDRFACVEPTGIWDLGGRVGRHAIGLTGVLRSPIIPRVIS